jgi:hypothetical protein
VVSQQRSGDLLIVTARASTPDGRTDEEIGVVSLNDNAGKPLTGEGLANAMMRGVTKAKRRVTLSICGLGWLDETEVGSVPGARRVRVADTGEILGPDEADEADEPPPAPAPRRLAAPAAAQAAPAAVQAERPAVQAAQAGQRWDAAALRAEWRRRAALLDRHGLEHPPEPAADADRVALNTACGKLTGVLADAYDRLYADAAVAAGGAAGGPAAVLPAKLDVRTSGWTALEPAYAELYGAWAALYDEEPDGADRADRGEPDAEDGAAPDGGGDPDEPDFWDGAEVHFGPGTGRTERLLERELGRALPGLEAPPAERAGHEAHSAGRQRVQMPTRPQLNLLAELGEKLRREVDAQGLTRGQAAELIEALTAEYARRQEGGA